MRIAFTIILATIFMSCSSQKRIAEFESILGKKESETLTYLVKDFEKNYLKKNYPKMSINDAYKKFLNDAINTGNLPKPKDVLKIGFEEFERSNLKLEIYSVPDSVWLEKNKTDLTLMIKWRYLKNDGTFEYRISESYGNYPKNMTEEELEEFSKRYREINYLGRYNQAFNEVFKKSGFIKEYFEYRDSMGNSNPSIFINRLLDSNPDFNDYFTKRITVIELAYW